MVVNTIHRFLTFTTISTAVGISFCLEISHCKSMVEWSFNQANKLVSKMLFSYLDKSERYSSQNI